MTADAKPRTVDEYVAGFPPETRAKLREVREAVRALVPEAEETVSYGIGAFTLLGRQLVYFAGHKAHVGVYPAPVENAELKEALAPYAAGKGTVRFALDRPLPLDVLEAVVRFREADVRARAAAKGARKRKAPPPSTGEGG